MNGVINVDKSVLSRGVVEKLNEYNKNGIKRFTSDKDAHFYNVQRTNSCGSCKEQLLK